MTLQIWKKNIFQNRRAKNIAISGLCTSSQSGKDFVENLCNSELRFKLQMAKCRRLGSPRDGRVVFNLFWLFYSQLMIPSS